MSATNLAAMSATNLAAVLVLSLLPLVRSGDIDLESYGQNPCPARSEGTGAVRCQISCFRVDPMCGVNGVTYWCGCPEAACAGVQVAKVGSCQVGDGGTGQAFLLVHIVWLVVLGFSLLFGIF